MRLTMNRALLAIDALLVTSGVMTHRPIVLVFAAVNVIAVVGIQRRKRSI